MGNIQGAPEGRKFKLQAAKDGSVPFSTGSGVSAAARPGSDSWNYFKKWPRLGAEPLCNQGFEFSSEW